MAGKHARKQIRLVEVVAALGIAALAAGLLIHTAAVAQGVRDGLQICVAVLVPALFPFMVLSCYLSLTGYAGVLSIPLAPLTTRVFKLPGELGFVVLLSLIGGYPVGARAISSLLEQGRIDNATAERMLCFCVNCGPSFLISAVGAGMLRDRRAGWLLFAIQATATLLVGAAVSLRAKRAEIRTVSKDSEPRGAAAFVSAVTMASSSMLAMCAFAVLFSGLLALLAASGVYQRLAWLLHLDIRTIETVVGGIFEVTTGCLRGAAWGGTGGFLLLCAFASFGGLSVLCQVMSCFRGKKVRFAPMVCARLAHAALSCVIAVPVYMYSGMQTAREVWLPAEPPILRTNGYLLVGCVGVLAMALALAIFSKLYKIEK